MFRKELTVDTITDKARRYIQIQALLKELGTEKTALREELLGHAKTAGDVDAKGNYIYGDGKVSVKAERKVRITLDDKRALEILSEEYPEIDQSRFLVTSVDKDKIDDAISTGELEAEKFASAATGKETFALKVRKV